MKTVQIAQLVAYVADSAVATICMTYLSVYFGKWWIVLFAVLLSPNFKVWFSGWMAEREKRAHDQEKP